MDGAPIAKRGGIPRGISNTGPIVFSYGFRPFFLGAASWAILSMVLWIAAIEFGFPAGGTYGAVQWHAHEMLFGFAPAVLAGFLLTAVPNWTGRLPVSGFPLVVLLSIWLAGRVAMLSSGTIGLLPAVAIDASFLLSFLFICAREVIAGRKWKDLKVIAGLAGLTTANIFFHYSVINGDATGTATRLAISAYAMLVIIVGGRILPSFTRNWLNRFGRTDFPAPYDTFDVTAIFGALGTFALWTFWPESKGTAIAAVVAAILQGVRLMRWRGWTTHPEKLLLVLHAAYLFVSLGFIAITAGATGLMDQVSVLHVLTIGSIACMMLAVMTRVSRGHTGRVLTSSATTNAAYMAIIAAAIVRPVANVFPATHQVLVPAAGILWILAFGLFLFEYAPMLTRAKRTSK
ncbi:MAG: NnrS family protein [Phyllobacterium sp.]|uniref:NnrS family protein n=1 Tax=Phyllobacterium sp. TaxID=1871046 RepID=UPI0030F3009B